MKPSWKWIEPAFMLAVHDSLIADHGGKEGVRDPALIESALARPSNMAAYEEADVYCLAAECGWEIAGNHGFIDGNKRTAYLITRLFLRVNRNDLTAPAVDRVLFFEKLGDGSLTVEEFAAWLRKYVS